MNDFQPDGRHVCRLALVLLLVLGVVYLFAAIGGVALHAVRSRQAPAPAVEMPPEYVAPVVSTMQVGESRAVSREALKVDVQHQVYIDTTAETRRPGHDCKIGPSWPILVTREEHGYSVMIFGPHAWTPAPFSYQGSTGHAPVTGVGFSQMHE